MNKLMIVVLSSMTLLRAISEPVVSGSPEEVAAHLSSIPGQVILTADAAVTVEADRAEVVLMVRNSERSFKNALVVNQQLRADIMAELEKSGLPATRIRMSRFSTTPTQGYFTSKVKSYEVESRVTVEVLTEKEIQAIAALIDEKDAVTLLSLTYNNSQKDEHSSAVVQQALAKVYVLRKIYEKELGVELVPRAIGPQPAPPRPEFARRGSSYGKDVSGFSSVLSNPELSVMMHTLASQEPDISQFDQVVYTATVTVTFDVVPKASK